MLERECAAPAPLVTPPGGDGCTNVDEVAGTSDPGQLENLGALLDNLIDNLMFDEPNAKASVRGAHRLEFAHTDVMS